MRSRQNIQMLCRYYLLLPVFAESLSFKSTAISGYFSATFVFSPGSLSMSFSSYVLTLWPFLAINFHLSVLIQRNRIFRNASVLWYPPIMVSQYITDDFPSLSFFINGNRERPSDSFVFAIPSISRIVGIISI